jgi:hypothetical protein
MTTKSYTLLGVDRRPYHSPTRGTLGGHMRGRLYGRLDCKAALRAIARGGYVGDRVFFADESIAVAAGFRPCAVCLPESYARWKLARGRSMDRRQQLLKRLDKAWRDFEASYAGLPDPELLEPGVTGAWSVRDIVAHVTTWEEEALKHLPVVLRGNKPPRYSVTYGGIDAFNALTTEQKKSLSLPEVFRHQEDVHRRLIELIEGVPEDQLGGDTRFRHRLRLDTYGHYPKHAGAIREWRERRSSIRS